jgi:hypothetical protein
VIGFFKDKRQIIIGFLFVLSIVPFFIRLAKKNDNGVSKDKKELFCSELTSLNSVQQIVDYIDSTYHKSSTSKGLDTALYVKISSDFIKKRFYHGLSHYTINDNWIAAIAGKLFWSHLSAIVKPEDILKHGEGLCSQQTIVFLEVLRRKNIHFRTIGLGFKEGPGHFLSEVSYNGSWHLHDVTVEPRWEKVVNHHKSIGYYMNNKDSLFLAYDGRLDRKVFDRIMEKMVYGSVDEFPAKNMLLFHQITLVLTYLIPLVLFIMFFITLFKSKAVSKTDKNSY